MVQGSPDGAPGFSTLHTNDASGAIPRLVDMGVEPYLLAIEPDCHPGPAPGAVTVPGVQAARRGPGADLRAGASGAARRRLAVCGAAPAVQAATTAASRDARASLNSMEVNERFHDPIVRRAGAPEYLRLAQSAGMRT